MSTSLSGEFGFSPQVGRDRTPTTWYRHKAINVNSGPVDLSQPGNFEVGGVPVYSAPHKAGYSAGGVIDMQPRFISTFGWLLHGMLGYYDGGAEDFDEDYIIPSAPLTVAPQATYSTDLSAIPVTTGRKMSATLIAVGAGGDGTFSGIITINGTDSGDAPQTEDLTFTNAVRFTTIKGLLDFKTVTSVDLPAYTSDGDIVSIGYESGVAHTFKFSPTDPAALKWMAFRKYIPRVDDVPTTDLLEEHYDGKIAGMSIGFNNNGLMQAQFGYRARDFEYFDAPAADWDNDFEDYESMPVSVKTDGYFHVNEFNIEGGGIPENDLRIIGAQVAFQNNFIPEGVDRTYGDPRLDTLEVASRGFQAGVNMKWANPEIYRMITTNSLTGSVWSEVPLIGKMDASALSIANMPGETQPYALRIQVNRAMFQLSHAAPLMSNNVVLVGYNLIGMDNAGGEYCSITLRNLEAPGYYGWPT